MILDYGFGNIGLKVEIIFWYTNFGDVELQNKVVLNKIIYTHLCCMKNI